MFAHELRHTIQRLFQTPAFTIAAIVSLALGIGANAAMFNLLDALLFRPLPVREPDRLIQIGAMASNGLTVPLPSPLLDELRHDALLDGVCGFQTPLSTVQLKTTPEPVGALSVTSDCYKTLGVRPAIGRIFTAEDDEPNGPRVAMLSYDFWRERFGGNPNVMGQTIRVEGFLYTVIGVTEQRFRGLLLGFAPGISFLSSQERAHGSGASNKPVLFWGDVLARLKPGATAVQVQAELNTRWRRLLDRYLPTDQFKGAQREELLKRPVHITPAASGIDYSLRERFHRPLTALVAVSFLVLLVSCINVANLLFARGLKMRREIAIQFALGASRGRIVRSQLLESALLLAGGLVSAALAAYVCDRLLISIVSRYYVGFWVASAPDANVLVFTGASALLALLLVGLIPAWQNSDIDSAAALKAASRSLTGGRATNRRILVCVQVALTLVLVTGAVVFAETLRHLETENLGFQSEAVMDAQLMPVPNAFGNTVNAGNYYRGLMDRMRSLPGVEAVSMSSFSPVFTKPYKEDIRRVEAPEGIVVQATGQFVTDGFFNTMHIPLLRGRDFSRGDNPQAQKTTIVSRSLAMRLFPNGSALGRHIQFGTEPETKDLEITGIAADARLEDIHTDDLGFVYFNFWQHPRTGKFGNLQVRYGGGSAQMATSIREELQKMGRQYALYVRPVSEQRNYSLLRERLLAILGMLFAILAVTLAAVGLFGLLSFFVTSRTNEIGLRMALGAERRSIGWLVLREALVLVGTGIAVGLPVCYAGVRGLSSLLYGVSATAGRPLLVSAVVLCMVSIAAALIPAHRASSVDPMIALRQE